jgi:uncharacterized protein
MSDLVRVGECRRCGDCCRDMAYLDIGNRPEVIEWLQARFSGKVEILPDRSTDDIVWISVPQVCEQLIENPDGTCACKLQENKPELCRVYPETPDSLPAGCGFRFEPTEGG